MEYVIIKWTTTDVQSIRPDLDETEAYKVLLYIKNHHDASIGVNWDVIETIADMLYPIHDIT
jgi:hypothetical protein